MNRIQFSANYIRPGNSQVSVLCSSANNSDKVRDIIGSSPTVQPVSDIRCAADTVMTREGGDEGRTAKRDGENTGGGVVF